MKQESNFAAQVAANESAQAHAQEIQKTRVGGLGGSDAAMLLRIAANGLAGLTATDTKRLCVMIGASALEDWGGNAYTNAGHEFEDYCERLLPWGAGAYEREKVIEQRLAHNFRTFAHADFVTGDKSDTVVECKYVQQNTAAVRQKYNAQLQWYYLLGAKHVILCHGWGDVEPFEVQECELVQVARDEAVINMLLHGIKLLDEALTSGWRPEPIEKEIISNTPEMVQKAFADMEDIKRREKALADEKAAAANILKEYIEGFGLTGIIGVGETKHQVIYTRGGVSKTFDAAKFLKEHPEFNERPEYWKTTTRAASITFK